MRNNGFRNIKYILEDLDPTIRQNESEEVVHVCIENSLGKFDLDYSKSGYWNIECHVGDSHKIIKGDQYRPFTTLLCDIRDEDGIFLEHILSHEGDEVDVTVVTMRRIRKIRWGMDIAKIYDELIRYITEDRTGTRFNDVGDILRICDYNYSANHYHWHNEDDDDRCRGCHLGHEMRLVHKNSLGSFMFLAINQFEPEEEYMWNIQMYKDGMHKRWDGKSWDVFLVLLIDIYQERGEFINELFFRTIGSKEIAPSDILDIINKKYTVDDIISRLTV